MLFIRNARLYTITHGILENGDMLIEDGKIAAVGQKLTAPEGSAVLDATGRTVTPGIIDAHCHVAIAEQGVGGVGNDLNEVSDPATPQCRAIDAINPRDEAFQNALEAGITTLWITPGSANVIGGQGTTMHTFGRTVDEMVINPFSGLKAAFGENPKAFHKAKIATRMATAAIFRDWFYKAKAYLKKQEAARQRGDEPELDIRLEPIAAVLRGELPVRIHAHRHDDILTAIRCCNEFDVKFTIEHCTAGHLIVPELKAQKNLLGVVVGPTMGQKGKVEVVERSWKTAGILAAAGLKVAMMTDHPVLPIQYLPLAGAYAVKAGMDSDLALRALTLAPAEICGLGNRLGSLDVGKDADIAIFSGHPFESTSETVATVIGGKVVYQNPKFHDVKAELRA